MENISKLGLESKCSTPYSNGLLQYSLCFLDGWFTFYSDKQRERKRRKKTPNLKRGHKPVVTKAPVFKLTKRGNAFGLNPKQQQVLNTSMCPLAAIKHSKRGRRDTFRVSFLSMRARTCAICVLYGSESGCLGSIKHSITGHI